MWLVCLIIIAGLMAFVMFGWAVQYKATGGYRGGAIGDVILAIANAPTDLMLILDVGLKPAMQRQRIEFSEFDNLEFIDADFKDQGLLLVSGFNLEHGISSVYLYDLGKAQKLYEWIPPHEEIASQTSYHVNFNAKSSYRTQHPLLISDGSLLFTSGEGPL